MKVLKIAAGVALVVALTSFLLGTVPEPQPPVPFFFGVVSEDVRTTLRSEWTDTFPQVERAYCIVAYRRSVRFDGVGPVIVDNVLGVVPAAHDSVTGSAVYGVRCEAGDPVLHVHPPTSCDDSGYCIKGGPLAFQCRASRQDYLSLKADRDPYGVVQCGPDQFVFFYPFEYPPLDN